MAGNKVSGVADVCTVGVREEPGGGRECASECVLMEARGSVEAPRSVPGLRRD